MCDPARLSRPRRHQAPGVAPVPVKSATVCVCRAAAAVAGATTAAKNQRKSGKISLGLDSTRGGGDSTRARGKEEIMHQNAIGTN